jgi:membrane protein required for colicin V production
VNWLDLFILIPVAFGAWNGYRKGLLIEVVGVVAFVLAGIVGYKFFNFGIDLLAPYISVELARRVLPVLGFSIIFFPTVYLVNQIGFAIRRAMKFSVLGTVDSLAGAAVGLLTWLFGISVLFWLLSFTGVNLPAKYTAGALVYPRVVPVAPWVMGQTMAKLNGPTAYQSSR